MPDKTFLLDNSDEQWRELLDSIEISAIPIEYISKICIHLTNGSIYDIIVDPLKLSDESLDNIEESLETLIEECHDMIDRIDFQLNTDRIKNDISRETEDFLKNGK